MMTIGQKADRRPDTLNGNSNLRRTLLASNDAPISIEQSSIRREMVSGKRRKGLLSTPDDDKSEMTVAGDQVLAKQHQTDDTLRKRRALLPETAMQPTSRNSILGSNATTTSTEGILTPTAPAGTRRVLLSTTASSAVIPSVIPSRIPENVPATEDLLKSNSEFPINASAALRGIRPTLLAQAVEAIKTAERQVMNTKSTSTDASLETDLAWLHYQRALIDRRIAELKQPDDKSDKTQDSVVYVSGYYCRACRQFIDGDYDDKMAHCRTDEHLLNTEAGGNDPEAVMKYFEERYDGLAFDDDNSEPETSVAVSQPSHISSWRPLDRTRPDTSNTISTGSSVRRTNYENATNGSYGANDRDSDDDDDRDRGSSCERFDRTRISRN